MSLPLSTGTSKATFNTGEAETPGEALAATVGSGELGPLDVGHGGAALHRGVAALLGLLGVGFTGGGKQNREAKTHFPML